MIWKSRDCRSMGIPLSLVEYPQLPCLRLTVVPSSFFASAFFLNPSSRFFASRASLSGSGSLFLCFFFFCSCFFEFPPLGSSWFLCSISFQRATASPLSLNPVTSRISDHGLLGFSAFRRSMTRSSSVKSPSLKFGSPCFLPDFG